MSTQSTSQQSLSPQSLNQPIRVLLLSAYDAASHAYWRKSLVAQFPNYDWTVLTLPPRYFAWRLRGNSLSWAFGEREVLEQDYDLVLATSMTDLSALRGFVPKLATTPTLVYFHENQFAYPESGKEYGSLEPKILNIYTALAADKILFNSHYNRDSFLQGVAKLLKKMPDQVPPGIVEHLTQRSQVLPVPLMDQLYNVEKNQVDSKGRQDSRDSEAVDIAWSKPATQSDNAIRIVWSARWEFDKGPDRLLAIMGELESRGINYRMAIMGERFRKIPQEFNTIEQEFSHRLDQFGFAETREEYLAWLSDGDIVLSTATHEFQGVAILEAVVKGCIPVLPDREVYPELFGTDYVYPHCGTDIKKEAKAAVDMIIQRAEQINSGQLSAPDAQRFSWSELREKYQAEMISTAVSAG